MGRKRTHFISQLHKDIEEKWMAELIAGVLIILLVVASFLNGHAGWESMCPIVVVNGCEVQTPEERLLTELNLAVDSYINVGQMIKTAPYYTNETALATVIQYDAVIEAAAEKYGVDKAMVQSVLFQELRFYGMEDPVADLYVRASYQYGHRQEEHGKPQNMSLCRLDSSTGMGQVFAKTAIKAHNWKYNTAYNPDNWEDLEMFWMYLQEDEQNIDTVALVLAHTMSEQEVSGELSLAETEAVMARYNGTGVWAAKYGQVTIQYYQAFVEYNQMD